MFVHGKITLISTACSQKIIQLNSLTGTCYNTASPSGHHSWRLHVQFPSPDEYLSSRMPRSGVSAVLTFDLSRSSPDWTCYQSTKLGLDVSAKVYYFLALTDTDCLLCNKSQNRAWRGSSLLESQDGNNHGVSRRPRKFSTKNFVVSTCTVSKFIVRWVHGRNLNFSVCQCKL